MLHRITNILAAGEGGGGGGTGLTTGGLQGWISDNIIPLLMLLAAVVVFSYASKGDNSRIAKVFVGLLAGMAILGMATGGTDGVSQWAWGLISG